MDEAALILRITIGCIFLAQGVRKVLGQPDAPHGRMALQGLIAGGSLPMPALSATLAGYVELIGGSLVLVGLLTRFALIPLIVILLGAIYLKFKQGFLGGWDWPFSVLGACIALFALGSGEFSIDELIGP